MSEVGETAGKPSSNVEAKAADKVETKIATLNSELGIGAPSVLESKAAVRPDDLNRPEVSAPTIARMMGVATSNELKLIENKLDMVATKLNAVVAKLEKVATGFSSMPTGSDLERIDVQIGALRSMLKDFIDTQAAMAEVQLEQNQNAAAPTAAVKPPGK